MAGKEATMILLDVGSAMYQDYQGSTQKQRRLDISLDCIQLMLQNKIFNHKTHEVGLILFGTHEAQDGNTIYVQELIKPDLEFVRSVGAIGNHEESEFEGGDIFDALDKAIDALEQHVGTKKIDKKIFILTCGAGATSSSEKQIQKLIRSIEKTDVKINFICIDFMNEYDPIMDDPEKPDLLEVLNARILSQTYPKQDQCTNSRLVFLMTQELRNNMRIFPAQIAFELYSQFQTKNVSSRASYRGDFLLNDESSIQVLIYKRTAEERIPTLKKYSLQSEFSREISKNQIKNDTVFYIENDVTMAPVDKDQIIKGYVYGRHTVPIDSLMEEKMKHKCPRSFQLIGFVEKDRIPRHYYMSSVDMVVATDSEKSQKSLSSLITAMIATKKVAIARFVSRENGSPKLMILIPHKSKSYACLWMMSLPTAEDIRQFQFTSLKRSTPAQQHAVAQLIDNMDLQAIPNEDGQPEELLKMKYVANPVRQYFQQAIMHKAITQTDVLPPISPIILEYLHPETRVNNYAKEFIQKLKAVFKFKVNEIKKAADKKIFWKQLFDQESTTVQANDDVVIINQEEEEMVQTLAKQKFGFNDDIIKEIGTVDPLADFKKMVTEKRVDQVDDALKQIQSIIVRLVDESVKGSYFDKALECLKEMRKASNTEDEPEVFNKFLIQLKDRYNQQLFWAQIIKEGISLISQSEHRDSQVTVVAAQEVLFKYISSQIKKTPKIRHLLINSKMRMRNYSQKLNDIINIKNMQIYISDGLYQFIQ